MAVKLSKNAKARIKRMSASERKALQKAACLLADNDVISSGRYSAVMRLNKSCY